MTHNSPWQFNDRMAHLAWGNDRAQVDLRAPQRGVQLLLAGTNDVALEMLGVDLVDATPEPGDVFVRGGDLVVTYEQTVARPARVQIYWRWIASYAEQLTFDLIVSVQTSLLDSWPSLQTRSALMASKAQRLTKQLEEVRLGSAVEFVRESEEATACLGFALGELPLGYVEMIHPSDFWRGGIAPAEADASRSVCGWDLFPQHLEKGVILRARLRGVVLRTAPTEMMIAELHEAFLAERLPLTV